LTQTDFKEGTTEAVEYAPEHTDARFVRELQFLFLPDQLPQELHIAGVVADSRLREQTTIFFNPPSGQHF